MDAHGIITRETWQATRLYCPRCGKGGGAVWHIVHSSSVQNVSRTPTFLCISCCHVGMGWEGFTPRWNPQDRAQQIIQFAFEESQ